LTVDEKAIMDGLLNIDMGGKLNHSLLLYVEVISKKTRWCLLTGVFVLISEYTPTVSAE
jgi:hypothetical protein